MEIFAPEELIAIARRTGFSKRDSKMSPNSFFDIMMYDASSVHSKSLNQLAIEAMSEYDIGITKQGIDKRFNDKTLDFFKYLIEKQLSVKLDQSIEAGWLGSFNRVLIKDGTRFDLPEAFHDRLPGSGGSASKAGACLQFEYDLKSGNITDLNLTPANRPDARDAKEVLTTVAKKDLVLRDLGYYGFSAFKNIISKEAFFISRLFLSTVVFEQRQGRLQRLDFKDLYAYFQKHQLSRMELDVFIGAQEKIPLRLVIELLPEAVYEKRSRNNRKVEKKTGYQPSEEYLFASRFNLFITNVPQEIVPVSVVSQLYRMRWQIELIFKVWKSVIGIHHARRMKYTRWMCLLYFKLLLMIINWNAILVQRGLLYSQKGQLLSLNKCFKTLFDNTLRLRTALKQGLSGIKNFIQWVAKTLNQNHGLERKKESTGLEKIFYLLYCKSNIYVYI